jgi:hypothetical protein
MKKTKKIKYKTKRGKERVKFSVMFGSGHVALEQSTKFLSLYLEWIGFSMALGD